MSTARPPTVATLTGAQARRIALAAQQLHRPRREIAVNKGHLRRLVGQIGVLQIDSVNVLARAHYLSAFARWGNYPTSVIDTAAWPARHRDRSLIETFAHVAALFPVDLEPLLRWRQQRMAVRWRPGDVLDEHPDFARRVLRVIADQGPMSAGAVEQALGAGRGPGGWWGWSATKKVCEYLFACGELAVAGRKSFERQYDLAANVIPASILAQPTPEPADAIRELLRMASRHHGIGTVADLADYYRVSIAAASTALAELADEGAVLPVAVDGWKDRAWLAADAPMPRSATGAALLCPFDPLIWFRARTERMFDFFYRIEIYTPQPKRVYGYYVFPLLAGDKIVGRFDLKADRSAGALLVQASWLEPGNPPGPTAKTAAGELLEMARWLQLDDVVVVPRGDLHGEVMAALAAAR